MYIAHASLQIHDLGIEKEVIMTSKNSVAAQNRFIYYPDHLVRMPGPGGSIPGNLYSFFTEPVFKGLVSGLWKETRTPRRPKDLMDESVGSFISRRFGSPLADNMVSAIFHGIYAGDIYQLSARSILPQQWHLEGRDWSKEGPDSQKSSVIVAMAQNFMQDETEILAHDALFIDYYKTRKLRSKVKEIGLSSVYTFKRGIGQLTESLGNKLKERSNVTIHKNTVIKTLELARTTNRTGSTSSKPDSVRDD